MNEDANIIREMIRHEDNLTINRLNWLITLQGLLFASLAFSWDKSRLLTYLLIFLGLFFSFMLLRYLQLSNQAITRLLKWWEKKQNNYDGPPVIGLEDQEIAKLILMILPWKSIPFIFICSWFVVLIARFFNL
ncbi:hypothetical protein [Nostoc sp. CALU 546]|uniref:hypothetical protein n=1 Tax=Nostoc sp. CALU 546 TaxID=1867241 RepID=UPI003B68082B